MFQSSIVKTSILLSTLLLVGCGSNTDSTENDIAQTQQEQIEISVANTPDSTITLSKSEVYTGDVITFDADSDGDVVSYLWQNEAGDVLSEEKKFDRYFSEAGNYTTLLTVTNDAGLSKTVRKDVTCAPLKSEPVEVIANKAPLAKATAKSVEVLSRDCVYLHADGSVDSDGKIVKFEWRDKNGVVISCKSNAAKTLHYMPSLDKNGDGTNSVAFTLIVTDDQGASSSETIMITVKRGYEVPAVGTRTPLSAMNFPLGEVTFDNGFTLKATWGVGSGATHKRGDDTKTFYTLTDRGVNVKCKDDEKLLGLDICDAGKIFPFPTFTPSIMKFELDGEDTIVKEVIALKDRCGRPITGISNPLSTFSEDAFDKHGNAMTFDPNGLDTEAIAVMADGTFWLSEEYAPSLIHVAADGKIIKRLVPAGLEKELCAANYTVEGSLPEILKLRRANRGIESIALSPDEKTLYFAMQSPLENPDYKKTRNLRIYAMPVDNPSEIKEYFYEIDLPDTFNIDNESKTRKQSDVKVSEITVMEDGRLLISERISFSNKLYLVDLSKETPLNEMYRDLAQTPTLEEETTLTPVAKTKVFDTDLEKDFPSKVEGIVNFDNGEFLFVNDNDFGIAGDDTVAKKVALDVDKELDKKHVVGRVVFFDTDGVFEKSVAVGILPDMVKFTHDGKKVLVANEGEPVGNEDLEEVLYDPYGSVSIIDMATFAVRNIDFKTITTPPAGSKIRKGAEVARDFEPEYIAISEDDKTAWVSLQESNAVAKIDLNSDTLESVFGLGFKDLSKAENALDYMKDDVLNIEPTPVGVFGMYQPDTIASYSVAGVHYLITANEGDDRDDFYEETIKASKLTHSTIPDIGDLRVNPDIGDANDDGDYEGLYSYGARSFSIWSADGVQVFDSGSDFEKEVAARYPDQLNTRDKKGKWKGLDERSEKKGVEPEALSVAKIGDKVFAYIGLEKQGGLFVYDITNPSAPIMIEYNNDINYDIDSKDSDPASDIDDIAPEGMVTFVQDATHYLAVANEGSGTVSLYTLAADGKATKQGTYYTGIYDDSAAEIVDYDSDTKRLFVTNSADNAIMILDVSNPADIKKVSSIVLSKYGTGVNSVSVKNGKIAVAVERKE